MAQQPHAREAKMFVEHRKQVYEAAKAQHPDRWSDAIRDWSLLDHVWLNPENPLPDLDKAA